MRSTPPRSTLRAARGDLRALLVLNGLLLGLLAAVTFAPTADAQYRARGSYTMSAGRVNGADSAAVYIVDTANQELIAVSYNPNTKLIDGIGYRNLVTDAAEVRRGRARPATGGN
ncbi:MAG: hypothetical protein ACYS0D_13725 [Planctomycetota bacterium]|jgi:hypothetical protein